MPTAASFISFIVLAVIKIVESFKKEIEARERLRIFRQRERQQREISSSFVKKEKSSKREKSTKKDNQIAIKSKIPIKFAKEKDLLRPSINSVFFFS